MHEHGRCMAAREGDAVNGNVSADADMPMLQRLWHWQQQGWLRRIDYEFAYFLAQHAANAPTQAAALEPVLLAAALCSWQLGSGHTCLDMAAAIEKPEQALSLNREICEYVRALSLEKWVQACWQWPRLVQSGLSEAGSASMQSKQGEADSSWVQPGPDEGSSPPMHSGPGALGSSLIQSGMTEDSSPLVLEGCRLYLRRYRQYERQVSAAVLQRLAQPGMQPEQEAALAAGLATLFPPPAQAGSYTDWQMIACALAARRRFGLITGGPGTGKTTTVVRLLALLQMLAWQGPASGRRFLQIGLAAPTGKAAARLNSSIRGAIQKLQLDRIEDGELIRQAIPSEVSTLHRLLGSQRRTRHFRHDARHPLALDVLVIDEASMVDLEMMAMVVQALPADARLILLGDKDQLASVEAGAILGELCAQAQEGHYWPETAHWIARVTGQQIDPGLIDPDGRLLDQGIGMLRHSHRFRADSGIGALADRVNRGDVSGVRRVWAESESRMQAGAAADIRRIEVPDRARTLLRQLVVQGWAGLPAPGLTGGASSQPGMARPAQGATGEPLGETLTLPGMEPPDDGRRPRARRARRPESSAEGTCGEALMDAVGYAHYLKHMHATRPAEDADMVAFVGWAAGVLEAHGRFQLLAALRQGAWGVEQLNQQIAQWLHRQGLIAASEGWYAGRPVMVTSNDYELGLMNGDVGITLAGPGQALRVAFAGEPGGPAVRWVLPSRLQNVETVFAMTVHKAQGSEFDHAALAIPAELSPVLTRELVYTAITRARRYFSLCGPQGLSALFDEAIRRRVLRTSGLVEGMDEGRA